MPEFFIEVYTYSQGYGVRTEWIRDPETGKAVGKRDIPVEEMYPTGFHTESMAFSDYHEAIAWCEEHSTPECEYHLAAESPEELRGIDSFEEGWPEV